MVHSGLPEEFKLDATVLGADRDNDLAVLRLQGDLSKLPAPLPVEVEMQPDRIAARLHFWVSRSVRGWGRKSPPAHRP